MIFSRPGEDSFFLPVAFAAGSMRPLRDINYIFQRWMQFRNKNPLNMSDVWSQIFNFFLERKYIFPDSFHILSFFQLHFAIRFPPYFVQWKIKRISLCIYIYISQTFLQKLVKFIFFVLFILLKIYFT